MIEVFATNQNSYLQEFLNQLLQDGYKIISVVFINGENIIPYYEIIANKSILNKKCPHSPINRKKKLQ